MESPILKDTPLAYVTGAYSTTHRKFERLAINPRADAKSCNCHFTIVKRSLLRSLTALTIALQSINQDKGMILLAVRRTKCLNVPCAYMIKHCSIKSRVVTAVCSTEPLVKYQSDLASHSFH